MESNATSPTWSEDEFTELQSVAADLSEAAGSTPKGEVTVMSEIGSTYAVLQVYVERTDRPNHTHRVLVMKYMAEQFSMQVNAGVIMEKVDFEELIADARDHLWPAI